MESRFKQALERHLTQHAAKLEAGEQRLGWKIAFNAPPMQERLGLPHSLVAGMTRQTLCEAQPAHSLRESAHVALEAEVGVLLGGDIGVADSDQSIEAAIEGMGPAIEVIDINRPWEEIEEIIAEGVFQRGVVFGEMRPPAPGASLVGVRAQVEMDGKSVADVDAGAATGHPVKVLRLIAELLEPFGQALKAGDRIILGSMNAPPAAAVGSRFSNSLEGFEPLSIDFVA
jgi:2-keto-4-pentenoate hydratase